jgi:thiol-disulfide isomerase/thioredoxin
MFSDKQPTTGIMKYSFFLLISVFALAFAGSAFAQGNLESEEWKAFTRSTEQYDSLQAIFQKMVEEDPELQKNPSLLQSRMAKDMKEINAIYQSLSTNAEPAVASLGDDFSIYSIDELRIVKMAAIAVRKVDKAVIINEQLLKYVEDRDSLLVLRMELAKYYSFLKKYDEAAAYATNDVLNKASDQDKVQFYPSIAKGFTEQGNLDKAMLYAFKALETMKSFREFTAQRLKGSEREEEETGMMNRFFIEEYTKLLFTISYAMKGDDSLKTSFMAEAKEIIGDEATWGQVSTAVDQKSTQQNQEDGRMNKPAEEWDKHDWVNSDALSVAGLKGKVVLIDFFATWCRPCIMAFPHIKEWQEKYEKDGLVIVGLTSYQNRYKGKEVTPAQERDKMKNDFIKENKISWAIGIEAEGQDTFQDYGVRGIPHVVLIDREGKTRYVKTGASEYEQTEDMIKKLLAE